MDDNSMTILLDRIDGRGHGKGMAATGIGLAAGLGGAALLASIIGWVANNEASKARNTGTMALSAANAAALGQLNTAFNNERIAAENRIANERASREAWQSANQPTIQSYIDVQATPTAQSTASAAAEAAAFAQLYNNPLNAAVGTDSFLKIQRYSAPQPCGCDTCNG